MSSSVARRLTVLILATPLTLAACSSQDSPAPAPASSTASATSAFGDLKAGQQVDKTRFFQAAKDAADKNKTYTFSTEVGQSGQVSTISGTVDNRDDNNRKREITTRETATGTQTQFVVAGGQVYTRQGTSGPWQAQPISPRIEALMAGPGKVSDSADATQSIVYVGDEDLRGQKTRHFTLTVDPAKATASAAPTATAAATSGATSASATTAATPAATATSGAAAGATLDYWLDDQNRTVKMSHLVQGVPNTTVYDKWGQDVTINVPGPGDLASGAATTSGVPTGSATAPTTSH